ncbi:MAG TPA: hypothetical protein VFZ34_06020, partial [Blastocatellia bacterium]|nr:hypothetical protein [Blastocatellia bacterium]
MNNQTPFAEYTARLEQRRRAAAQHALSFRRIGFVRIAFLMLGVIVVWRSLAVRDAGLMWWLVPLGIGSLLLLGLHQRIFRQQKQAERAVRFYDRGLARLAGNWAGT